MQRYAERWLALSEQPGLAGLPLDEFAAAAPATGAIACFALSGAVHRNNVRQVLAAIANCHADNGS